MKPPAAAAELASAALQRLGPVERTRAYLPTAIAAGRDLDDADVAVIADFWAQPPAPASPDWVLAGHLLGGDPMRRAITAAATPEEAVGQPDPGPRTGAMIAAVVDPDAAAQLAVTDGLPVDDLHITLAFFGPADDLNDLARAELLGVAADTAAAWGPMVATAGHLAFLGPDDGAWAVAYDLTAPDLHDLRADLVARLADAGLGYSNRYAFRPHMTVTWLTDPEVEGWEEGPVDVAEMAETPSSDPPLLPIIALMARIGPDVEQVYPLTASPAPQESPVTAAAADPGLPALSSALDAVWASLASIDADAQVAIRTAIEMGWASALDRVGRMATRQATGAARRQLAALTPPDAALVAAAAGIDTLDIPNLIAAAVADTVAHVTRVIAATQAQVTAIIADAFGVDLVEVWPDPTAAAAHLKASLADALLFRLGVLSDPNRIDPTTDEGEPLEVPYQITRDVIAIAGGATTTTLDGRTTVTRDGLGLPLDLAGNAGVDSIAFGPAAVRSIDDAIAAWADVATQPAEVQRGPLVFTAAARRRAGANISADLSADLAEAASRMQPGAAAPLERQMVYTWRINANGQATVNLPRHERMNGTTVTSEAELNAIPDAQADPNEWPGVAVSRPGDHARCHCAWVPSIRLVPAQQVLDV